MYGEVSLKWITPNVDQMIGHMARVSNPKAKSTDSAAKLIGYLIAHHHWSPFEMANMCVEIATTRDIGRQILRHRSFTFQEFSQRYSGVEELIMDRDVRFQHPTNRQASIDSVDETQTAAWRELLSVVKDSIEPAYKGMLESGIAKECARAILPEGLTPTRMYMNGTIRSWIHYCKERTADGVQKEHQLLAKKISEILRTQCPEIYEAMEAS